MDLERLMHVRHKPAIYVAVILSALVVVAVALVGRGTLNLKGALALDEPTDVTVIAAVEPKLSDATITSIEFLRKEPKVSEQFGRPPYTYLVGISSGESYLTRLEWDSIKRAWALVTFERLHAETQ